MYIDKDIFKRANLQQISSFILFREETVDQTESFEKRLDNARALSHDALRKVSTGELGLSDGQQDLTEALEIYQEVCVEIGMKLGAKILHQLLNMDDDLLETK